MVKRRFKAAADSRFGLRASRLHQALAAALMIGVAPFTASAATVAATSPDDTDPTSITTCTLRQAILSMNTGMLKGNCANAVPSDAFGMNDTITFAPSIVTGALIPGTITLADSNDATGNIGGMLLIAANDLTIDAIEWRGNGPNQYPGGVTIIRPATATNDFRILRASAPAGASLTLSGLTLSQGSALDDTCGPILIPVGGGGICAVDINLSLIHSTISGNSSSNYLPGGGIFCSGGTLTVSDSTISGNTGSDGGGLYIRNATTDVNRSTISGNDGGSGGGISMFFGALSVTNSTITGNTASKGGGIYMNSANNLSVHHATVTNNTAFLDGGIKGTSGGNVHLRTEISNSVLAGNTQTTGYDVAIDGYVEGYYGVDNLVRNPVDLGPLQDNGGPTQTMLPLPFSITIDYASACGAGIDQRGVSRPQGAFCDVGAVETRRGSATLSVTVEGNGAVSGRGINNCSSSGGVCSASYGYDETVPVVLASLAVTPARGWLVTSVIPTPTICGGTLSADGLTYTTTTPMQDCAITVQFSENDVIFTDGFEGQ